MSIPRADASSCLKASGLTVRRGERLLFADLAILDFDRGDARAAGEIRAGLARKGTPIGPFDVLIAGQAKHRGAILVTNNVGEFRRVEQLRLEDWTEGAG